MRARVVGAIARKDIREVFGQRAVWGPALFMPACQTTLIPLYIYFMTQARDPKSLPDVPTELVKQLVAQAPPDLHALVHGLPIAPTLALLFAGQQVAPIFLLAPLGVVTVVGATAFIGEKETRTLEALLYSPATDAELLAGKLLACALPAMGVALAAFVAYGFALTAATWPLLHRAWFPTSSWWPWLLWITPAAVMLAGLLVVAISARARSQAAANQLGSVVVFVVMALVAGQTMGYIGGSLRAAWLAGAGLWGIDLLLWAWAVRSFSRARLIRRL